MVNNPIYPWYPHAGVHKWIFIYVYKQARHMQVAAINAAAHLLCRQLLRVAQKKIK